VGVDLLPALRDVDRDRDRLHGTFVPLYAARR
jgi:hypothetical protein